MRDYFEPTLTEEQLSAYLDGMLTPEENSMIEQMIDADPVLQEVQDIIDDVDATLIDYTYNEEIPAELLDANFELPQVNGDGIYYPTADDDVNPQADFYDNEDYSEDVYPIEENYNEDILGDDAPAYDDFI